ncbi:MAG: HD domain-containing protein [Chloroflexi bacterium]|nr:HD domain-containing protein [Chloroflexota bacterium]
MSEIRDSLHGFIYLDDVERLLIDSPAVQRLKYIHQLALSYLVYPGATHTRFEHALGTMELAGRAFDAIARNSPDESRAVFGDEHSQRRWRAVIRAAALLHDVGHAPFSHAGDRLFTDTIKNHEQMTVVIILDDTIASILAGHGTYRLDPAEVAFVATGLGTPTSQAALVAKEVITGDLGVDRMDYLWRDSQMCGVSYGKYDLPRMVETLMLAKAPEGDPTLAVEHGGRYAAEGLLTARYFMFSQVYFHDIRVAYDEHLLRFLQSHLPGGCYPEDARSYLQWDDVRAMMLLRDHQDDRNAQAILARQHYRRAYEFTPGELGLRLTLVEDLAASLEQKFGDQVFLTDSRKSTRSLAQGQVLVVDHETDKVDDILELSGTLDGFKPIWLARVFSDERIRTDVRNVVKTTWPSPGGPPRSLHYDSDVVSSRGLCDRCSGQGVKPRRSYSGSKAPFPGRRLGTSAERASFLALPSWPVFAGARWRAPGVAGCWRCRSGSWRRRLRSSVLGGAKARRGSANHPCGIQAS